MKSFIRFIIFLFIGIVVTAILSVALESELIIYFGSAILTYLIPTFIAFARKVPSTASIAVINIFLGWSIIGFIVALVWAFKKYDYVPPSLRNKE